MKIWTVKLHGKYILHVISDSGNRKQWGRIFIENNRTWDFQGLHHGTNLNKNEIWNLENASNQVCLNHVILSDSNLGNGPIASIKLGSLRDKTCANKLARANFLVFGCFPKGCNTLWIACLSEGSAVVLVETEWMHTINQISIQTNHKQDGNLLGFTYPKHMQRSDLLSLPLLQQNALMLKSHTGHVSASALPVATVSPPSEVFAVLEVSVVALSSTEASALSTYIKVSKSSA